jgi:putative serine/threonine protein kinase
MDESIYEPQEDSFLLVSQVKKFAHGKVLDMGTGSGIQAFAAYPNAKFVIALDINPNAVNFVKDLIIMQKKHNMLAEASNLFSFFENHYAEYDPIKKDFKISKAKNKHNNFDTIIFNPPYLPKHEGEDEDVDLYVSGGKHGYEIIVNFLEDIPKYLERDGCVLIVFSSITKKNRIDEILSNNLLDFSVISTEKLAYEELYCYRIQRSGFLKELEDKGITGVKKFSRGHRGDIYLGNYKKKDVIVKRQRQDVKVSSIKNEINYLNQLSKYGFTRKVLLEGKDYFVYEFIQGQFIRRFLDIETDKSKIKKVLIDVMKKMRLLDNLNINKEEMHHPHKHVLINKSLKTFLIDFERAGYTQEPKNVTQFVQYICSAADLLNKNGFDLDVEKLRNSAKAYKYSRNDKNFRHILKLVN